VCAALSLPAPGRCVANANEIRASFGRAQRHSPHGLDRTPGSTDGARCIQCDEGASAVPVPKREGEHLDGPAHEEGENNQQVQRDEHDDRVEAAARECALQSAPEGRPSRALHAGHRMSYVCLLRVAHPLQPAEPQRCHPAHPPQTWEPVLFRSVVLVCAPHRTAPKALGSPHLPVESQPPPSRATSRWKPMHTIAAETYLP
jgi:hypothetical protein